MQAKLVIVGGKANKRDVLLKLPTIIGRSREADLTVAHPMVSRKHCELFEVDGLLTVRDLGSLNGTLVAGERVKEAALRPEDEFTVGPLTFRVKYEYTGEIPAAPPVGAVDEEVPDFQIIGEEGESLEVESAAPSDEAAAAGQPAGIAPAEGELPDFDAWGEADGDVELVQTEPQLGEAQPPAPPPEEPVLLEKPVEEAVEGVGETGGEQAAAEQPGAEQPPLLEPVGDEEPPLLEIPADEEVEAAGAPSSEAPEEPEIEPDFEAWEETRTQVAADLLGGGQPVLQPVQPEEIAEVDAPAAEKSEAPQAPAAKAEKPAEAPPEEKKKTPSGPPPKDQGPPAAAQEDKVEQLPDFLAGPDTGPQAEEEEEEPEDEPEESPEDQALNDFLKGLS